MRRDLLAEKLLEREVVSKVAVSEQGDEQTLDEFFLAEDLC